jgi:hypothetical protein
MSQCPRLKPSSFARKRRKLTWRGIKLNLFITMLGLSLPYRLLSAQKPDLSSLTQEERESIESACLYDKNINGPAAYHRCLQGQLNMLSGTKKPDMSGLTQEERESIESACLYDKNINGPAAYHRCLRGQLNMLSGTKKPDTSGLTQEERESIESACLYDKNINGPAAYHRCLQRQLKELGRTADYAPESRSQSPAKVSSTATTTQEQSPAAISAQKRLGFFVGTWRISGTIHQSSLGPAGSLAGSQHIEWGADATSLISTWEEQRSTGRDSGTGAYRYDPKLESYFYHGTSKDGEVEDSTGMFTGDTWVWSSDLRSQDGTAMKGRFTIKVISSSSYTFRFEISSQADKWSTVTEGTAQKQ